MEDNINMTDVVAEVKNANEDELKEVIKHWLEAMRTSGMKLGAKYISAAIMGAIQKHLHKEGKVTLRDYKRCMDDISKIISVQLKKQEETATSAAIETEEESTTEAVEERETTNE
jgi:hypothetical protein